MKNLEGQISEFTNGMYHLVAHASLKTLKDIGVLHKLNIVNFPFSDEEINYHKRKYLSTKGSKAGAYFIGIILLGTICAIASPLFSDTPQEIYL